MKQPTGRARAIALNKAFLEHKDKYVLLLLDVDVKLRFTLCRLRLDAEGQPVLTDAGGPIWDILSGTKKEMEDARDSPTLREHWFGYSPEVIRYETLKEFGDHHRRHHWRWNQQVLFVGKPEEMLRLSRLTRRGKDGMWLDKGTGLYVPQSSLKALIHGG